MKDNDFTLPENNFTDSDFVETIRNITPETNHTERLHSWLSPSGIAPIVDGCVGKPRMEKGLPDRTNSAAERGTRIHEYAEMIFTGTMPDKVELDYDEVQEARNYVEYVYKIKDACGGRLFIEEEVDVFPDIGIKGHVDAIVWDAKNKNLHVIDLKTGKTKVEVMNNSQLLCYAHGAYIKLPAILGLEFVDCQKIFIHVFQDHVGICVDYDPNQLGQKAFIIEGKANLAHAIYNREELPTLEELKENRNCIWCKAKRNCPLLLGKIKEKTKLHLDALTVIDDETLARVASLPHPDLLTDAQKVNLIKYKHLIEGLIEDVEESLMIRLLNGEEVPGVKIKPGKEVREWGDEMLVVAKLATEGITPYKTKLITITEAEKILGKGKLDGLTTLKKQKDTLQIV